jgi:hypothetical protein
MSVHKVTIYTTYGDTNNRWIMMTFIVKEWTGLEKNRGFTESNEY